MEKNNDQQIDPQKVYVQDTFVFEKGVEEADLSKPVNAYQDERGNMAVADGQHRAKKAWNLRVPLVGRVIGNLSKDVSQDPGYRHISGVEEK